MLLCCVLCASCARLKLSVLFIVNNPSGELVECD
jgi:hypothetical protein